jgi:aminoglycoside phosphotransferase (APT) family kinase protein
MNFYAEISGSENWNKVELVEKGWSDDKKYHILTKDGRELLLRLSDISQLKVKQEEFRWMNKLSKSNILMSRPLEIGLCNQNKSVYLLHTWIKGKDAENYLTRASQQEQYKLGLKAGEYLKEIHNLSVTEEQEEWYLKFNRKIDRNIRNYEAGKIKLEEANLYIQYINKHRELLKFRPQSFQHGDYHTGNMIITSQGELGIIDFNRFDYGDPWEEFNRIVWCVEASKSFASAYINGYFANKVPALFWKLMALYIVSNQLASIPWASKFGAKEVEIMINQAKAVTEWYDDFKLSIPHWDVTDINN